MQEQVVGFGLAGRGASARKEVGDGDREGESGGKEAGNEEEEEEEERKMHLGF